jgi:hypothetical protein
VIQEPPRSRLVTLICLGRIEFFLFCIRERDVYFRCQKCVIAPLAHGIDDAITMTEQLRCRFAASFAKELLFQAFAHLAAVLIVISHRPATILWADRILVVAEGTVVDSGKPMS